MKQALSRRLLCWAGWKIGEAKGVDLEKCIICVAPHTSNWDFILGKLFYMAIGCKASFLIKKDWFIFPFNFLFRRMRGVPVDRGRRTSVTEQMAGEFKSRRHFQLAITPEGTRKPISEWKKGFYYIALNANVPILLGCLDYGRKVVGISEVFYPTGDVEKDMIHIRSHYRGIKGRNPYNFIDVDDYSIYRHS